MGVVEKIKSLLPVRIREHVPGYLVNPDDYLFRRLGPATELADPNNNVDREKQILLSHYWYFNDANGRAIVDNVVQAAIGCGMKWNASDPKVQELIDRFMKDPDSDWDGNQKKHAAESQIYGELFFPIFITPENGDVRCGFIHPLQVETVVWHPGDCRKPIAFVQKPNSITGSDTKKTLWIVPWPSPVDGKWPRHPALTPDEEPGSVVGMDGLPVVLPTSPAGVVWPEIQQLVESGEYRVGGYSWYFRANCLSHGRGQSIYRPVNNWLKMFRDFWAAQVRNIILQGYILWFVTLKDIKDKQTLEDRHTQIQEMGLASGSIVVKNDEEEWEAQAPKVVPAANVKEVRDGMLKTIGTGVSIPSHLIGAEADSNRATSKEASVLFNGRAKDLQRDFKSWFTAMIAYMLAQKEYAGQLLGVEDLSFEILLAELDAEDSLEAANALKTTVDSCITAVDAGFMLRKTAIAKVAEAAKTDVPTEEELDAEKERREQEREEKLMGQMNGRLQKALQQANEPRQPTANGNGNGPMDLGANRPDTRVQR